MENYEKQESQTNAALLQSSLQVFARANPDIKRAIIRSDNAGCYHSEDFLTPMWEMRNSFDQLKIVGHQFSASGDGKGNFSFKS